MTKSQQYNTTDDEVSLKELLLKIREWWKYFLSKWIIILIFGFLGGVLGLTYAIYKKPIYTATTTFVLEESDKGGGLGNLGGLASIAGIDLGGGGGLFQGDNIIELYKSRAMIQKALLTPVANGDKKELLVNRYINFNKLKDNWSNQSELNNLSFDNYAKGNRLKDSVLGGIVDNIKKEYLQVTRPDKKTSIIKTEIKAPDELFALLFNEQIVKNVNDFYIETKTKKSLENVKILQYKTDSVRSVMNSNIYTAVAASDITPNLNPTRQVQRAVPVQRSQFSAETNKSVLQELLKNLELSKVTLLKEKPLIQVIDQPALPLSKEKVGKAKGLVVGGLLGTILITLILFLRKSVKDLTE